jgi:AraC family transcriptional regulator
MTLKTAGAEIAVGRREPRDPVRDSQEWATPRIGALSPALTLRISAYIEAHLDQRCRTAELARVAGLSKSHFTRLFAKRFGSRAQVYIMHRRVAMAQALMQTEAPLSEIALSCGMSDQSHFSKQFRRVVGVSPSVWRRSVTVNAPDRVNP